MSSHTLSTLADYIEAHALTAECRPCGRLEDLDIPALAERYGWDMEIPGLQRRLVCSVCGQRAVLTVRPQKQAGPW